jgi:hypothetical protein
MQFCLSTFHFSLEDAQCIFSIESRGENNECRLSTHVVAEGDVPALPAYIIIHNPAMQGGVVNLRRVLDQYPDWCKMSELIWANLYAEHTYLPMEVI